MRMTVYRHLWGMAGTPETLLPLIKDRGYQGVEMGAPGVEGREHMRALLDAHGLSYIAQIFTAGSSVAEHLASFRQQIEDAQALRPRLINCHSGSDAWTREQAEAFFAEALAIEADAGVPVAHETHRGRVFYTPWTTRALLERFERLALCCDYSHWVCVCERLIDDQQETLALCAERCIHLHARVGYEEGPQVPDPRAPEYQAQVAAHERWWDMIWDAQTRRGMDETTLTPEFGPPLYLHTLPYTNAPVADLDAICDWQAERQRARFERRERD